MGDSDPTRERTARRRSVLKHLGTGAFAGATGLVAIEGAEASDCWTETDCQSGTCQTHYPCRVMERTCCFDGGYVTCSAWEWNDDCCSDC